MSARALEYLPLCSYYRQPDDAGTATTWSPSCPARASASATFDCSTWSTEIATPRSRPLAVPRLAGVIARRWLACARERSESALVGYARTIVVWSPTSTTTPRDFQNAPRATTLTQPGTGTGSVGGSLAPAPARGGAGQPLEPRIDPLLDPIVEALHPAKPSP